MTKRHYRLRKELNRAYGVKGEEEAAYVRMGKKVELEARMGWGCDVRMTMKALPHRCSLEGQQNGRVQRRAAS